RSKRDWSSDVCSSDLRLDFGRLGSLQKQAAGQILPPDSGRTTAIGGRDFALGALCTGHYRGSAARPVGGRAMSWRLQVTKLGARSEERRVGKEGRGGG